MVANSRPPPPPHYQWIYFGGPFEPHKRMSRASFDRACKAADKTLQECTSPAPEKVAPALPAIGPAIKPILSALAWTVGYLVIIWMPVVGFVVYLAATHPRPGGWVFVSFVIAAMSVLLCPFWIGVSSDIRWAQRRGEDPRTVAEQWRDLGRLAERIAREI